MRSFLKRFLIWLAIAWALAYALDFMITVGIRKTDIRKYAAWNDIYKRRIDADLVIIGSSRAWVSYNTYILDSLLHCNSYNLGIDGHHLDMQLIRYDTYRRFNPAPKMVLANVDATSSFDSMSEEQYEREQFFPYVSDGVLMSRVKGLKRITLIDRFCPLVRYFGYQDEIKDGLSSFFGRKDFRQGGMHKGYKGKDIPWKAPASLSAGFTRHVQIDASLVQLLDDFVYRSHSEGIQVIFVKSPIYTPYLDLFEGVEVFDSTLKAVADKYEVPILDYTRNPMCEDTCFFYNPNHLNKFGSEVFTRMLCEGLDSLKKTF